MTKALWGKTTTAVNTGYGLSGGGRLKKGSIQAKRYMARLRAMRGKKKRGRKLRGGDLGESLLGFTNTFTKSVNLLLEKMGTNAEEAVSSPEKVLALAKKYGPIAYGMVKSFISKIMNFIKKEKTVETPTKVPKKPIPQTRPIYRPRPRPTVRHSFF